MSNATTFTLPPDALSGPLVVCRSWISNGHWVVKRAACANLPPIEAFESDDAIITRYLPRRVQPWHATAEVLSTPSDGIPVRVFTDAAGTRAGFSRIYLRLFGLDTQTAQLYGTTPLAPFQNARRGAAATVLLMPVRL